MWACAVTKPLSQAEVYLNRLPMDLSGRRVVVCDPMLATGGSLAQVCDMVKERHASTVTVLCLIASVPGLASFRTRHPDVGVACVAVDPELDDRGFIVPGLGDAGRSPLRPARLIGWGIGATGRCPRPTARALSR